MTNLKRILIVAAIAAMSSVASAQPAGDDGITASPKQRQLLNESGKRMVKGTPTTPVASESQVAANDGITASPKTRQFLNESRTVPSESSTAGVASAGYRATGDDGITASPKLRDQLNERGSQFIVAPMK